MAIHTLPYGNKEQFEATGKQMASQASKYPGFTCRATYCDFADHKFFCDWEAPSKEVLEQAFKQMNVPFEAVYLVQMFDIAGARWS
jgi:hypothetical protein